MPSRPLAPLAIIAMASALALPARASPDPAALIALSASMMRIEAPRQGGGVAVGSGVVIAPDRVVTNCHVTRDAVQVTVVRGGIRLPAEAEASDLERDLCLLRVPGLPTRPATVGASNDLRIGQHLVALGYTGGFELQNSRGEVVDLHRYEGARVIQSSTFFSSGASGGGLFDEAGRLVGVLTFRLRGADAHYFAAPAEWVRQLSDDADRGPEPLRFHDVMPLAAEPRPYWQSERMPRFLTAAQLQQGDRWTELAEMAREWTRADPDDSEPWSLLGNALQRLGQVPEARRAYECALQLGPERPAARRTLSLLPAENAEARAQPPCPRRHL